LLNCIPENIQIAEGRKYFPRGSHAVFQPHVGQPCILLWTNKVRD